jgi:hypothetical protein
MESLLQAANFGPAHSDQTIAEKANVLTNHCFGNSLCFPPFHVLIAGSGLLFLVKMLTRIAVMTRCWRAWFGNAALDLFFFDFVRNIGKKP